ncbi:peptidoglycan DD-metalloendopeptidase family protein [Nocardioides sp. MAH-18]|uniref:Peptidoglycan DD-metalloendopeptidase family protein n=1 Tax=Nocardioides agri TaxID=2682843 RepID=A0A6L6XRK1_9ACTN|nr:peptidoglycan DD-metalloendopeptidase family protein [Nocardioides sp. CGMCC 1.13656]MVQ50021.1 peptidoglycan DD-metalloendopeptidase family protein [Nocardioides sp. MAH-18]
MLLAGGYVTASAEPSVPAPRAARPVVARTPAPARVVAAAEPLRERPRPEPRVVTRPTPPVVGTQPVPPVQSRPLARAISRSATAVRRVAAVSGWTLTPWTAPVARYRLTARFGDHGQHWAGTHTGLDFAAPTGTPVVAVDAGVVVAAGWNGSYGQQVAVRHADGTETSYSHLSGIGVARGASVAAGQLLGRVGATGNVTGPHLHLEVRPGGGEPTDPEDALRRHGVPIS